LILYITQSPLYLKDKATIRQTYFYNNIALKTIYFFVLI